MEPRNLSLLVHKALPHMPMHFSLTEPRVLTGKSVPTGEETEVPKDWLSVLLIHQATGRVSKDAWNRTRRTVLIPICFPINANSLSLVGIHDEHELPSSGSST